MILAYFFYQTQNFTNFFQSLKCMKTFYKQHGKNLHIYIQHQIIVSYCQLKCFGISHDFYVMEEALANVCNS